MKKAYYLIALMLAAVVLLAGCSLSAADFNDKTFLSQLEKAGFLPQEVIDNLPSYMTGADSADIPLYYWSKTAADSSTIQKIEVNTQDGKLTRYHYKSYYFVFDVGEKLTLEKGEKLAMKFIEVFRSDISGLAWTRGEWYQSIYAPGNMEAWVAEDESHKYGVMVNLNMGTVDYFSQQDK